MTVGRRVGAGRLAALTVAAFAATAAAPATDWVYFYTVDADGGGYVYSYDPASVALTDGKLFVHGKMTVKGFTSEFEVRIDCARGTFTEVSTTITDDKGVVSRVPDAERYTDRPISDGSSGAKLRSMFCTSV